MNLNLSFVKKAFVQMNVPIIWRKKEKKKTAEGCESFQQSGLRQGQSGTHCQTSSIACVRPAPSC